MDDKDLRIQTLIAETQWLRQELTMREEVIRALKGHIETLHTTVDIMEAHLLRHEQREG